MKHASRANPRHPLSIESRAIKPMTHASNAHNGNHVSGALCLPLSEPASISVGIG